MFKFFRSRVHESIALSASLAAALTLQLGWICNLLVERSHWVAEWFTLSSKIGPVSGLYLKMVIAYFLIFALSVLSFRGKDCSHWQQQVFWFLLISIGMYFILTLPAVYQFSIVVE